MSPMVILRATSSLEGHKSDTRVTCSNTQEGPKNQNRPKILISKNVIMKCAY
jgi:hypothetical protein